MAYKAKHNSLRCKTWDIFAKRKLAWLKEIGLTGKAYIINGYKIILKAALDLAIIEAPPGIAVLQYKRSSYTSGIYDPDIHADPIEVYYCDMFGYTNEAPVKTVPIQESTTYPTRYDGAGWLGHFALYPGGRDAIVNFAGIKPAKSELFISRYSSLLIQGLQVAAPGGLVQYLARLMSSVQYNSCVTSCVNTELTVDEVKDQYIYFTRTFDKAGNFFGDKALTYGYIILRPLPYYTATDILVDYAQFPIPTKSPPWPDNYWEALHSVCCYSWIYEGKLRTLWGLEGAQNIPQTELPLRDAVFLFADLDLTVPDDFSLVYAGWTTTKAIYDIDNSVFDLGGGDYNFGYNGMSVMAFTPAQHSWDHAQCKNVVFPRPDGTAVLFHYDQWDEVLTPNPLIILLNLTDTPSYTADYSIPYLGSRNVFPMSTVIDPVLDLHLYWEEAMYGDETLATEYSCIENMHYGTPLNGDWEAFPSLPSGVELMSFQIIEFTALKQIVLGIAYKATGDDIGTCVVLFDSTRDIFDWAVGRAFSEERLERSFATVFGDHPYVEKRKRYGGTTFSWSFFHSQPGYF